MSRTPESGGQGKRQGSLTDVQRPIPDWREPAPEQPWCIAHRGASDRAFGNSIDAFELAADDGADFWEVDVRSTRDGVLVAHHDATLKRLLGEPLALADVTAAEFQTLTRQAGQPMPLFDEVIELALARSAGLYVDAKDEQALGRVGRQMHRAGVQRAIITSFKARVLATRASEPGDYLHAVLVHKNQDPLMVAERARADLVHLCWEWADTSAEQLRDSGLFDACRARRLGVVLWHEERADVLASLLCLPVYGLCTNAPEVLRAVAGRRVRASESHPR